MVGEFNSLTVTYARVVEPLPPTPAGVYPGMPPPEGWEWSREIHYQEVDAARRRAASTGETVLEALLALYGIQLVPVDVAEILDVRWSGWVHWPDGRAAVAFTVQWNCNVVYNGSWVINVAAGGFSESTVLPNGAGVPSNPPPHRDYPPILLQPGTYTTDVWMWVGLTPGEYRVKASIDRGYGGVTIPVVYEKDLDVLEKTVIVLDYVPNLAERTLLFELRDLIAIANHDLNIWLTSGCLQAGAPVSAYCQLLIATSQASRRAAWLKREECVAAGIPDYIILYAWEQANF